MLHRIPMNRFSLVSHVSWPHWNVNQTLLVKNLMLSPQNGKECETGTIKLDPFSRLDTVPFLSWTRQHYRFICYSTLSWRCFQSLLKIPMTRRNYFLLLVAHMVQSSRAPFSSYRFEIFFTFIFLLDNYWFLFSFLVFLCWSHHLWPLFVFSSSYSFSSLCWALLPDNVCLSVLIKVFVITSPSF